MPEKEKLLETINTEDNDPTCYGSEKIGLIFHLGGLIPSNRGPLWSAKGEVASRLCKAISDMMGGVAS